MVRARLAGALPIGLPLGALAVTVGAAQHADRERGA
jgi:hypothetical protein